MAQCKAVLMRRSTLQSSLSRLLRPCDKLATCSASRGVLGKCLNLAKYPSQAFGGRTAGLLRRSLSGNAVTTSIHYQHYPLALETPKRCFHLLEGKCSVRQVHVAAAASENHETEPEFRYFATCTPGLEHIVADELASPHIDAQNVLPAKAGVGFTGTLAVGYRANLWLRCAVRVLMRMAEGELVPWRAAGDEVYDFIRDAVDWRSLLVVEGKRPRTQFQPPRLRTFWVESRVWDCTNVTHSGMVSVRAKDAICDAIRDSCQGLKPPPPENGAADADLPLFLTLYRDKATLYRDMSGVSLHKRGYRDAMHRASLNEGVAAGVLKLAGFVGGGFEQRTAARTSKGSDNVTVIRPGADLESVNGSAGSDSSRAVTLDDVDFKSNRAAVKCEGRGASAESTVTSSEGMVTSADGSLTSAGDKERARTHLEAGPSGRTGDGAVTSAGGRNDVARAGRPQSQVLLDPMCGSGTLLIEAALMAMNQAPGLLRRRWPFESWPDFDALLWDRCVCEAESSRTEWPAGLRLLGNDIHPGALELCRRDAAAAGVLDLLTLSQRDCAEYVPPAKPTHVAVNPPWGLRLDEMDREMQEEEHYMLVSAYEKLGAFLKARCSQADVYLLSGNADATRNMRLRADRKWPLSVGGIDCRVLHYKVLPPLGEAERRAIGEEKETRRRRLDKRGSDGREKEQVSKYGVREGRPFGERSGERNERGRGRQREGDRGGLVFDPRDDVDSERTVTRRGTREQKSRPSVWS